MSQLTAKQLEIRQREDLILATASPMIRRGGIAAISMDAIAKEMHYTRGTIYNHFPNKEDIVLSLAARAVQRRMDLFRFGSQLGKTSRQRVSAIGLACEVYVDHLPDDFLVEQIVRHDSVWQKTSTGRREVLQNCESQCIGLVSEVIDDAINAGDLTLPKGRETPDIVLGLWSLVYGGLLLEATSPSLRDAGIKDSRQAIRRNCNAMLDGLHWTELYDSSKYNRFVRRVMPLLADHAGQLATSPHPNH